MKNIKNRIFSEARQIFEKSETIQQWNQSSLHPETAKERICRQRRSYALHDEICVEGKTYPLSYLFAINAPQTAYEKLLNFLY